MTFKLNHALVSSALLLGVLATTGCKQPELNCTVAHGYFAAKYELESGDAASACGGFLGDVIGFNSYYADAGQRPDLDAGSIAIRPQYVNDLVFHAAEQGVVDETQNPNTQGVGDFNTAKPGDDEFCEAPTFSTAALSLPEVPEVLDDPETPDDDESYPLQPATDVSYKWSNVRILLNANAQGTQFVADLHFEQDGCAADYHVTGVYPVVGCETNDDCNDDANGINPDFGVECLVDLGLCVLSDEPPSYE